MVLEALAAAEELSKEGIEAEVVDIRTLRPLDIDTIAASVKKTGRAIVAVSYTHLDVYKRQFTEFTQGSTLRQRFLFTKGQHSPQFS